MQPVQCPGNDRLPRTVSLLVIAPSDPGMQALGLWSQVIKGHPLGDCHKN